MDFNTSFFDDSPQYPTHFIFNQSQQQGFANNLISFHHQQQEESSFGFQQQQSSSLQGTYGGISINETNHPHLSNYQLQRVVGSQMHTQYQPSLLPDQQKIIFEQHQQQQQQQQPLVTNQRSSNRKNKLKRKITYQGFSDEDMADEDEEEYDDDDDDDDFKAHRSTSARNKSSSAKTEAPVVMIPMATKLFEKMLDYRLNANTNQPEFLVKFKFSSYHHLEWLSKERVEAEHLGKHRIKKFLTKWNQDGQRGEDYSEYLKIDRIIDEGDLMDPLTGKTILYYLVKWNGLFYDASTWESEEDVKEMDSTKIIEFQRNRTIPQEKLPDPPKRPNYTQFVKYNQSQKYKFDNELRSYQLEGLNWLRFCYYHHRSCILADEMGLGKTVQSVAFLNDIYYRINIKGPFLIVAPLSTIPHWERAFKAWTNLNVIDYRGSILSRNLIAETEFYYKDIQSRTIPNRYKFDVLITTYEMALAGTHHIKDISWKCAVFDEAHRLKNKQSKVGEVLKSFSIDHKLLLTGTPLQNKLDELYSLLNFMQPEVFNNERAFFAEYGNLQTAAEVEKLQALLKPIMLRRFKEDVEKSIPVKEETVIEVELTNPQKKWYRAILEKNFNFLKKGGKTNREMPHLRNIMIQLRKCCIHPYLLEGAEEMIVSENRAKTIQDQFKCLIESSGKLVLIDKLLRKLFEGNHKVLIFSQFTSCLDILSDYLHGRQYPHERIDGSVPGEQRQAAIDRFSTLPINQSFVFLLCTRAGGVGINLTAADTCIIFDSDWNPQNDLQAQARCHRIGQTKPVKVYRLICRNTYEKDMFDRAGMKLGLDKAVMQRMNQHNVSQNESPEDESSPASISKNELNRKEIEDLLKKGAYGVIIDDSESEQFCAEDIDQILERRTTVIRHEGNEKGSVFSKATFSTTQNNEHDVELDDPDFWEKWAAQANLDMNEFQDENELIVYEPRKRRQVQRFGTRSADGIYDSSNDNADDSDAYEDESEKSRKRDQPRLWSLSEKTKYERKLMVYGYGPWKQMQAHFPRRTERDLKAVTRCLIRQVKHVLEGSTASEEDRKLLRDMEYILESDAQSEPPESDFTIPFVGATKRQIAEYRSFLIQAPADYREHIERKGRNFLLRIQMLYMVRDRIVPKDWEKAKVLPIPKVNGSLPCDWWGESEDRDLLLGIIKHGYQQYLTMRTLQEDDEEGSSTSEHKHHDDSPSDFVDRLEDKTVYVWPSKADIGMRLRRIIAAFLREDGNPNRRRKTDNSNLAEGLGHQSRSSRQRSRGGGSEAGNRWQKKSRSDFMRTILSFGVETVAGDPNIRWDRFRKLSGLEKRTDAALDMYYYKFYAACKEIMKKQAVTDEGQRSCRESSEEVIGGEELNLVETIPYDKARRALKRIEQMKKIRERVIVDPDFDKLIEKARRTSGLPPWWEVPLHDKALLRGICKHGIGRHDLMITDTELPFHQIVNESSSEDHQEANITLLLGRIGWPKDLVIQRRIESLCELILRPKPPSKRPNYNRKRKTLSSTTSSHHMDTNIETQSAEKPSTATGMMSGKHIGRVGGKTIHPGYIISPSVSNRRYLSDVATTSEEEEEEEKDDDAEEELRRQKKARYEMYLHQQQVQKRIPTKPLKSQSFSHPPSRYPSSSISNLTHSRFKGQSQLSSPSQDEMEEGEISDTTDDNDEYSVSNESSFFAS
ncbi:SNF2 family N-terminal domain-containing protein [Cokeromyces recurvatus]|uniref:SNF2 family N-terminal domain-containing protein n=1 Tax=Cokeromyces recurvatus TaxID=90255 RepID=UPI00221F9CAD|nr:SNF2 family N-terminal domain-containing protein [Cokeromyces recurvatus]KAI7898024.1 SNF2 family N-terminal domain-containing protein [Cokeromyces recurvatus]